MKCMNISTQHSTVRAIPVAGVALLIASCGGASSDDHYSSAEDFRAAMEEEGFPCEEVATSNELNGYGESLRCEEGHVLTVWEENLPDYVETNGEITDTHHLRSGTWEVASGNREQLEAMQDVFGGELTAERLIAPG